MIKTITIIETQEEIRLYVNTELILLAYNTHEDHYEIYLETDNEELLPYVKNFMMQYFTEEDYNHLLEYYKNDYALSTTLNHQYR